MSAISLLTSQISALERNNRLLRKEVNDLEKRVMQITEKFQELQNQVAAQEKASDRSTTGNRGQSTFHVLADH